MENYDLTLEKLKAIEKAMFPIQQTDQSVSYKLYLGEVLNQIHKIENRGDPEALRYAPKSRVKTTSRYNEQNEIKGKTLTLDNLKAIEKAMNELPKNDKSDYFYLYLVELERYIYQAKKPKTSKKNLSKEQIEKQRLIDLLEAAQKKQKDHMYNCQVCKDHFNDIHKKPKCPKYEQLSDVVKRRKERLNGDDSKILLL